MRTFAGKGEMELIDRYDINLSQCLVREVHQSGFLLLRHHAPSTTKRTQLRTTRKLSLWDKSQRTLQISRGDAVYNR